MDDKDQGASAGGLLMLGSSATGLGCLTPAIVLGAILLGRWLDAQFGTKPLILLVLVLSSIPVSLLVVVRALLDASRVEQARLAASRRGAAKQSQSPFDTNREDW